MGGGTHPDHLLIILPLPEPTSLTTHLRATFPSLTITYIHSTFAAYPHPAGFATLPPSTYARATILFTHADLPADPAHDAPHLRWVHFFSAGINPFINHPLYTDTDVTITTSSGVHGPQIAEWVAMTMLVQAHRYDMLRERQRRHEWGATAADLHAVRDAVGQRVGVLGYGSIGRQVGRVAKAMGMRVVAYTASPRETRESRRDDGYVVPGTGDVEGEVPEEWFSGLGKEGLHGFLRCGLDVVVVCVPLTEQTKHFLGAAEFEILAERKAMITNISRGAIIDQDALVDALKQGTLRGACLDVTDPEPLPKDSPLWDMDNVIITPHISGMSAAYTERCFAVLELNLGRFERGEGLVNVVDRKRGY